MNRTKRAMDRASVMIERQLTESQKACLRLVAAGRSSKEIALETGLSPQTIDQYLRRAAMTLGASNRREAARLFAELEKSGVETAAQSLDEVFNKSEFKTDEVAPTEKSGISVVPTEPGSLLSLQPKGRARMLPALGGQRHDLNRIEVLYAILRVSLITAAAAGAILAVYFWLNKVAL
jgi:DNA-binding CsgD family transcriptional regulator